MLTGVDDVDVVIPVKADDVDVVIPVNVDDVDVVIPVAETGGATSTSHNNNYKVAQSLTKKGVSGPKS